MSSLVRRRNWRLVGCTVAVVMLLVGGVLVATPADAQDVSSVCNGVTCENLPEGPICTDGGFKISLVSFTPGNTSNSGTATYTYKICSPVLGICNGTARPGESCSGNDFCKRRGGTTDPTAICSRECAVNEFRGLSHFDVGFPELGGSCLTQNTQVTGSCSCTTNASQTCSVGTTVVVGVDGSCDGTSPVAKCDGTTLGPGDCITMTLNIAGETTGLGLGRAVFVDKASTTCTDTCLAGPSCEPCDGGGDDGGQCLTRTRGFWGTHPRIAGLYDPVTVCGEVVNGSAPGTCSTSEALCTSANDYKQNPAYLTLVAQLTAAKLNLNATALLAPGATCSGFSLTGRSIQQIIAACEANFCNASNQAISNSGCIEALDAFNNSQDVGFDVTPAPFDAPGPAQPAQCQAARGNKMAIGVNLCN